MTRHLALLSFWTVTLLALGLVALLLGLRLSGYELLSVKTDSMAPAIGAGQAVLVDSADRDIRVGEVVSYASPRSPQIIVTHRVTATDWQRGMFVARGDNTDIADVPVPMRNLRGTVTRTIPFVGYGLDAMRHPVGILVAVYGPAIGIIGAEVRRLTRYYAGKPVSHRHYLLHVRMAHISRFSY